MGRRLGRGSLVRVAVALTTPPVDAALLSPVIGIVVIGGLLAWTVACSRRAQRDASAAAMTLESRAAV